MPVIDRYPTPATPPLPRQSAGVDAIQASAVPWSRLGRTERADLLVDDDWQTKVRLYDRHGPGIVGASLDMPAATSMLLDLVVQRRTPSGWKTVRDDPMLAAILGMWRGETIDQKTLFSRLLRTLDGPAECYLLLRNVDVPRRLYWQLAQTPNVVDNRDGSITYKGRRNARRGDKWHHIVEDRHVYHVLNSDPEWEGEPWSPLRRGLPQIELYRLALRNLGRNLRSQLAMNGIMWAQATAEAAAWPDQMINWAQRAISDDDGVEASVPLPMATASEPKFIDVGRSDHADQLAVADMFLKAFAQSTDLPTQMLLEGPGSQNHWNSFLEGDFYADMTMQPRWSRACSVLTETHLRPMLRGLRRTAAGYNPDDFRVWADDTRIRTRTDNTERILKAREFGLVDRETVAEAVGLNVEQMLELPEGVDDWTSWLISRGLLAPAGAAVEPELDPAVLGTVALPSGDTLEFGELESIRPGVSSRMVGPPDRDAALDRAEGGPLAAEVVLPRSMSSRDILAAARDINAELLDATVRKVRIDDLVDARR